MSIFQPPAYATVDGTTGYTDFTTAIKTLNSAAVSSTLLIPPGTHTVSENLPVNSNINLLFTKGAIISIGNTFTLTINGTIEAGTYQIFSWTGSGKVVFGLLAKSRLHVNWWGAYPNTTYLDHGAAINAALQAARDSGGACTIEFSAGIYTVYDSINATVLSYCHIKGGGSRATTIFGSLNSAYAVLDLTGFQNGKVSGLHIFGGNGFPRAQTIGILMARTSANQDCQVTLDDIFVDGYFDLAGIYNISVEESDMLNTNVSVSSDATATPYYAIFLGGENKDSVTSAYATVFPNGFSSYRMYNINTSAYGIASNFYFSHASYIDLQGSYVNGGAGGDNSAIVYLDSAQAIRISNLLSEAGHDYGIYITDDINGLVVDEACNFDGIINSIYQPTTKYIRGSSIRCAIQGNASVGISDSNYYMMKRYLTYTPTFTLYSTNRDFIQYDANTTLAVTTGGLSKSTIAGRAAYTTYSGSNPNTNVTPDFIGQELLQDNGGTKSWWKSTGVANNTWLQIG